MTRRYYKMLYIYLDTLNEFLSSSGLNYKHIDIENSYDRFSINTDENIDIMLFTKRFSNGNPGPYIFMFATTEECAILLELRCNIMWFDKVFETDIQEAFILFN